jgi:hypothetical protein
MNEFIKLYLQMDTSMQHHVIRVAAHHFTSHDPIT